MACTPPVRTLSLAINTPVWSKGGTNPGDSDIFVMSDEGIMQLAPLIARLRTTLTIDNPTNDFKCRTVLQATNDGCIWDTTVDIDTVRTGKGIWTSPWYTDATNFKRGIRFGVIAGQAGTSVLVEQGRVTVILDIEFKT